MKKVLIGAAIILVIFVILLQFIPLGIEPLTEVYFENHTFLRLNSFPDVEYNFSFTVHNLEYQDMAYNYTISRYDENGTFVEQIKDGRVSLGDNESATVFEKFILSRGFGRARIFVEVEKDHLGIIPDIKTKLWWPDPNYPNKFEIHFWTDEIAPITITHIPD